MSSVSGSILKVAKSQEERDIYKSQSEAVRDSVRQLAYQYELNAGSLKEVREITGRTSEKAGESLSHAVTKIREESA